MHFNKKVVRGTIKAYITVLALLGFFAFLKGVL